LFTAYVAVEDQVFSNYMISQQDQCHDGRVEFTVDSLMQLALDKYNVLVEANRWKPTNQKGSTLEEQIVALTAKVEFYQSQSTPKKGGDKREKARKARAVKKWAWKSVPPKEGEPKSKNVEGKTYNWCLNHASWTVHTAAECKINQGNHGASTHKKGSTGDKVKKALALSQAYQSIMDAQDEEDSNGETDGESVSTRT
jgi:hypothetical protein